MASADITLYAHWVSQPSRAVGWFCKLNNIPFNFEFVDFLKGDHKKEDFQKISPSGFIPVMRDSSCDVCICESNAILQYLAEKENCGDWFPADRKIKAQVLQYLHWHHSNTRKLTTSLFKPYVFGVLGRGPACDVPKATEEVVPALQKINEWLSSGSFLCGTSSPTIADVACYCEFDQIKLFNLGNLESYPAIQAWIAKMEQLPYHNEVHKDLNDLHASMKDKL